MALDINQLKEKNVKNSQSLSLPQGKESFFRRFKQIGTVPNKEKLFFVENLQVMISSGLPLDRSLRTLAKQTNNYKLKVILEKMASNTEKGVSFADNLRQFKSTFSEVFVNMVEAGELSGRLDEVLRQLYLQLKKSSDLRSNIKSAMTYPVIVIIAMVLIGIGMLIFVIPKIMTMFKDFGGELPLPTKILLGVSGFITTNGLLVFLIAVAAITGFILFIKHKKGRYLFHGFLLKLPIAGPIIQKINLAKFARNLSSLLKTDIPIVKTFEVTGQILSNLHYRKALEEAAQKLKKGSSIAESLQDFPKLFPPILIQMTITGEETGKLDNILGELATFYEEEIERIMKTMPSIIEPVLMVVLGGAVGLLAVAIIMPMYSITEKI